MPISKWVDKENVIYTHTHTANEILAFIFLKNLFIWETEHKEWVERCVEGLLDYIYIYIYRDYISLCGAWSQDPGIIPEAKADT